jgi:hypothetical protein
MLCLPPSQSREGQRAHVLTHGAAVVGCSPRVLRARVGLLRRLLEGLDFGPAGQALGRAPRELGLALHGLWRALHGERLVGVSIVAAGGFVAASECAREFGSALSPQCELQRV